ncbi:MAG: CRTAC1 family protein [Gemmataceae bacterium]
MRRAAFTILALAILPLGCQRAEPIASKPEPDFVAPWFEDVTERVGLNFVHDAGPVGDYFLPQVIGSGAALFDFDRDGRLDIYLLQNGGAKSASTNCLYRQIDGGRFVDVSKGSGLDIAGHNMGVAIGDINNDGWPDVVVTRYDPQEGGVKLFLNNGNGTFTDITKEAGLSNPSWGTSAAFFDYDRDGWLDLIVVNYLDYDPTWPGWSPQGPRDYCVPNTFRDRVSRLFHNLGARPTAERRGAGPNGAGSWKGFADVSESSGLGGLSGPGLGVVCADFDGDDWPDIFIANDGKANHLWINRKNGTFKEEALVHGLAYDGRGQAQAGMGIAWGDVDGDGLLDVFVTHLADETNTLWRQEPRGLYSDQSAIGGFLKSSARGTGFGAVLADFDHDGALDLAVVNGHVSARTKADDGTLGPFWSRYGDRNQIYRGDGRGHFDNLSLQNRAFCGRLNVARALAHGDIDGDGAIDLLVTTIGGRARLFKNIAPDRGHWFQVRAVDPALHRDALGAVVRLRAGGKSRVSSLHPADSYLSSSVPVAHFGLGTVNRVDAVEIVWPDGRRELFDNKRTGFDADRRLQLRKGDGHLLGERPASAGW